MSPQTNTNSSSKNSSPEFFFRDSYKQEHHKEAKYHPCLYCSTLVSGNDQYCCSACEHLDELQQTQGLVLSKKKTKIQEDLKYLNDERYLKEFSQNQSQTEYVFRIEGLQCASCVHLIEKLPQYLDNIKQMTVDYSQGLLFIELDQKQGLSELIQILKDWGYEAFPLKAQDLIYKKYQNQNRKQLKRLGVAGAIAGNIMLFTIPIYAGLDGSLKLTFLWIHFFIFLPLVFYSAVPFYTSAWNSLKMRTLSVDLPITLALWAGFLFSTYNLIHGSDDVYYDSTASFIFLILVTRYFVQRIQQVATSHRDLSTFIPPQTFRVLRNSVWNHLTTEQIEVGDLIEVKRHQVLPADGYLNSAQAEIDTSLFNGESLPQIYTIAMKVFAGTKLISESALLQVSSIGGQTAIGHIFHDVEKSSLKKNQFVQITDKISQILLLGVFVVAALYFLFLFQTNFHQAFNRALALIVIACPCALAFGSPLTFALALRNARRKGLLVKNASTFEKIREIKNIFLDKTGTLTEGQLKLSKSFPATFSEQEKSIIITLESVSEHPVAFAFRRAWPEVTHLKDLTELHEVPGVGVFGKNSTGDLFSLENSSGKEESGHVIVAFKKNGSTLGYFYFSDDILPESKAVIQKLQKRYHVYLLSGDRQSVVHSLGQSCGVSEDHCFSETSPNLKKQIIEKYQRSVMVGDGVNDILAFQAADVGISVRSSQIKNQNYADVVFLRSGLTPLIELIHLSDQTYRTLVSNLVFALLYNIGAGLLALMGLINPMMAAILMPIASTIILVNTFWGMRK